VRCESPPHPTTGCHRPGVRRQAGVHRVKHVLMMVHERLYRGG
jgi:hypothetical protein